MKKSNNCLKVALILIIFTARVRSTTGGCVFTGVCLLTQGGGYPKVGPPGQGRYPLP